MILPDVNVLIHAFRPDAERHADYKEWLECSLVREQAVGVSDVVLSGLVRITTHPRVFAKPSKIAEVFEFCTSLLVQPNVVRIVAGNRHWNIFAELCRRVEARGNLVADAYFAALAIECGAEWITTDRDFARFPGLRWRHPLQ